MSEWPSSLKSPVPIAFQLGPWIRAHRSSADYAGPVHFPDRRLTVGVLPQDVKVRSGGSRIGIADRHMAGCWSGRADAVVDGPGDRSVRSRGAGGGVGDGVELRLIGGEARRAGQSQHARGGVVAAGDARLGRADAQRIAQNEAGADAHRGRGKAARCLIGDGEPGVERDRGRSGVIADARARGHYRREAADRHMAGCWSGRVDAVVDGPEDRSARSRGVGGGVGYGVEFGLIGGEACPRRTRSAPPWRRCTGSRCRSGASRRSAYRPERSRR